MIPKTGQRRPERSIPTTWLALLCLLALPPATALGGSCTLARLGSVGFTIVDGELVVPVTVSGRRARMRVEVASSTTRIDGEYVQPFGIKTHYFPGFTVVNVGDKRITQQAALTDFAVGPLRVAKAEFLRRLYGFDETSPGVESETDQDGHTVAHYRAMSITGDGLSVKNARIELRTTKSHEVRCSLTTMEGPARYEGCLGGEAPLLIGLDVVRHLHLYFATKERVLYFSDATASK